jgi:hypothetical protein
MLPETNPGPERPDREEPDDPALADSPPELFAQLQAEAATTWRSPATARRSVRGCDRLRAWCDGFSLHAGVVVPDHDREGLERLCRYGARGRRTALDARGGD